MRCIKIHMSYKCFAVFILTGFYGHLLQIWICWPKVNYTTDVTA
jgi:hypothetical protein